MKYNQIIEVDAMQWDGVSNPIDVLEMLKSGSINNLHRLHDEDNDGSYELELFFPDGKMADCKVNIRPGQYVVMDHVGNVFALSEEEFKERGYEAVK